MNELNTITKLIESLRRLPGIGLKSAERMAYQILDMKEEYITQFIDAMDGVKSKIGKCPICGSYTEDDICPFCSDIERDSSTLVVVSYFKDALAFEKLKSYHGLYHILNGSLSPTKGIGINDINFSSLITRIKEGEIKEVILATNPTIEGETTALYIEKMLEQYNITISRLAYGLPMGAQLDYTDELTLTRAFEGRKIVRKE
ncbi:MAG: recombination protein RecR [Erysipelotrichaceae bacterium]|nr:recombination protein RecR [Erysipelotrichaceae bacterium]